MLLGRCHSSPFFSVCERLTKSRRLDGLLSGDKEQPPGKTIPNTKNHFPPMLLNVRIAVACCCVMIFVSLAYFWHIRCQGTSAGGNGFPEAAVGSQGWKCKRVKRLRGLMFWVSVWEFMLWQVRSIMADPGWTLVGVFWDSGSGETKW